MTDHHTDYVINRDVLFVNIVTADYRNQHRPLPDCQKADRKDNLYRPCAFQPDRKRDDGGQNQASAP